MKRNSLGGGSRPATWPSCCWSPRAFPISPSTCCARLADSQQKIRVQLAGANSRAEITRMARTRSPMRACSPNVRRCGACWASRGAEGLVPFLRRFCETSELDACAVFDGAQVVARAGRSCRGPSCTPWPRTGRALHGGAAGTRRSPVVGATPNYPRSTPRSASWSCTCSTIGGRVLFGAFGPAGQLINYRAYAPCR